MGTTPNYALPYPDDGASVNVPRDVRALADTTDTVLKTQLTNIAVAGLPTLNAIFQDYPALAGPTELDAPFLTIPINSGLTGAVIVSGGFLQLPTAGLYLMSLVSTASAGGWGGQIALSEVGLTSTMVFLYTTSPTLIRTSDTQLVRVTSGSVWKLHVATGGASAWIHNRLTITRVAN